MQRRHQKVVEIAPSINLPLELRKEICECGGAALQGGQLSQRRHRRVSARSGSPRVLLHRSESAHPGGAHGDGSRHRHRSGQEPDSRRPGAQAARSAAEHSAAGEDRDARVRDPVPDHHRRSGESFHPRLRPAHDVSLARRICRPARRRQRVRRRGHHALLRFAAGEGDHLGHDVRRERSAAWTGRCASSAFAA